jgi:hypothetical protein
MASPIFEFVYGRHRSAAERSDAEPRDVKPPAVNANET